MVGSTQGTCIATWVPPGLSVRGIGAPGAVSELDGFDDFYAAQFTSLRRFAFTLTGSWPDAEELAQEALARVYVRWRRLDHGSAHGYARRVVLNLHRSALRRLGTELRHRWRFAAHPAEQAPLGRQLDEPLAGALFRLPVRQRAVVYLRHYEDLSEHQVAEILGITLGTVKSTTSRALAALRQELGAGATGTGTRNRASTEDLP